MAILYIIATLCRLPPHSLFKQVTGQLNIGKLEVDCDSMTHPRLICLYLEHVEVLVTICVQRSGFHV